MADNPIDDPDQYDLSVDFAKCPKCGCVLIFDEFSLLPGPKGRRPLEWYCSCCEVFFDEAGLNAIYPRRQSRRIDKRGHFMNLRCKKCGFTRTSDDHYALCQECGLVMDVVNPDGYDAPAKYPGPMSHGLSKFPDEL